VCEGAHRIHLPQHRVGCFERGSESFTSVNVLVFLDQLSNYWLLKDSAALLSYGTYLPTCAADYVVPKVRLAPSFETPHAPT
jgi:hypothetical protein